MQTNTYPNVLDGTVDAGDIAALLAELQDTGSSVTGANDTANVHQHRETSAPRSGVGGTSVLGDQRRSAHAAPWLRHRALSQKGGASDSTAPPHRASTAGRPEVASGSPAPTGFSTYDLADAGLEDAQLSSQHLSATPLGVRLAPLGGGNRTLRMGPSPSSLSMAAQQTPLPVSQCPGSAAEGSGVPQSSLAPQPPLPPLPSLGARGARASHSGIAEAGGSLGGPAPSSLLADRLLRPTPNDASAAAATATPSTSEAPREVNFLPLMCARYLRPVGMTPTARLGHTLTPVTPDTMLLFGGLDLHGEETASLMAFSTTTISWEPLYTLSESPAARHSHAACAYDGRYLVVSGGVAQNSGAVLNDVHLYDMHTHHWRCVWDGQRDGSAENRNEPGPRFGHTIVSQEDRLYLYGGKTTSEWRHHSRRGSGIGTTASATLASGSEVYVFSLNTFRWRRRVRAAKERRTSSAAQEAAARSPAKTTEQADVENQEVLRARPATRAYHAACIKGNTMYINGGAGASEVLTDTWSVQLNTGEWHCIHRGGTADAVPREKHAMFVCSEALLLVGGCSSGGTLHERITGKFTHFAVVLPLVGVAVSSPCWIPVAMGNASIVQPQRKGFSAALTGGFVYVFGGVCGAEPPTNSMVRFLAADGYVSENDQAAGAGSVGDGGAQQLRLKLQQLREQHRGTPFDCYAYAGTYGSANVASAIAQLPAPWSAPAAGEDSGLLHQQQQLLVKAGEDVPIAGLHRAIVHQRAPLLLQQLEGCRSELYRCGSGASSSHVRLPQRQQQHRISSGKADDEVDALLVQVAEGQHDGNAKAVAPSSANASADGAGGLPVYFTNGTPRVPGLAQPLTADALQCLVDYIYWGGLRAKYRLLLEEEKDEHGGDGAEGSSGRPAASVSTSSFAAEYRAHLVQTLEIIKAASETYALTPLAALCAGLLAGDREQVRLARLRSCEQLRSDMAELLASPSIGANTTMLVVDPHTKEQSAHVLHACILLAASDLFTELLRPLYRAVSGGPAGVGTSCNHVGTLAAQVSTTAAASPLALLTSSSKRTVLIGPVPLPLPAVQPILRYLYTQQLQVPSETALEVMIGAHQLGLTPLQALCEAIVAREEVSYQTCCSLYYLARKYEASLLEEIALLTAVSGFVTVRHTSAYQLLSDGDRQHIDAVAAELGSSAWVPPPPPQTVVKPRAVYSALWDASAPSAV
ncbi:hypothetical protein LSCM1_02944 [Leishmania martiniquensis]|uniref:BTB domain-containing protein n=1 Tax=Leishmania martiniquensis TaxID=1580590 RepID=A0A836HJI9_9TRYP|nr:hypothetical protein LSCM1_02944 [Leishmania martiniquensis]